MEQEITLAARMALALSLGIAIGWEREGARKPAGLRTQTLVCMGAALFTIVSIFGFAAGWDNARVAAQIVTGIGFLGAGTILREGANVKGLTTAATIWTAAAIGMASGAGLYLIAIVSTALTLFVLRFMPTGGK
ncbi:MAG: MgtC/SapB family protein [SAR202 cluster bacterium]|nr:MgtC/SapB family protein [SAR202 cluster bacterium]